MSNVTDQEQERKYSKFQVFFLLIFIPALFSLSILFGVLTVAGVDVKDKVVQMAEYVPFIDSEKEEVQKRSVEEQNKQIESLQDELDNRNETIDLYEKKVNTLSAEKEKLQLEVQQLQELLDEQQQERKGENIELKELMSTYEKMTPKRTALIVSELTEDQGLLLLQQLKSDKRSAVLEKMDPKTAAKYTSLLVQNMDLE
ncbi:hypothetical protein [Bacillus sp. CGMCC 1.16541]|uniref:MotE family protein n=1 Tax=Bacillus sp. CGMCC 1.16541 TaxID=2185143 RepID=UPI000D731E13|nr:hypothetical protein [Bacillus sp. CGMCC 1.16541]